MSISVFVCDSSPVGIVAKSGAIPIPNLTWLLLLFNSHVYLSVIQLCKYTTMHMLRVNCGQIVTQDRAEATGWSSVSCQSSLTAYTTTIL